MEPTPGRRRVTSLGLTVAVHLLLLWLFWQIAPVVLREPGGDPALATFDVAEQAAPAARKAPSPKQAAKAAAQAAPPRPSPPSPPRVETPPTDGPITLPPGFIVLNRRDYASSNIAGKQGPARGTQVADAGDEGGSEAGGGAGIPGPERLFDADWAREPTSAELNGYLPRGRPVSGYGMIACKTIPGLRVDECKILGESPAGSGLGRAVLNAAWQFRVLPPRIGSKAVVGAWVRIRITYEQGVGR